MSRFVYNETRVVNESYFVSLVYDDSSILCDDSFFIIQFVNNDFHRVYEYKLDDYQQASKYLANLLDLDEEDIKTIITHRSALTTKRTRTRQRTTQQTARF